VLTYIAFGFRIMDLGSHFMAFPLEKESRHFSCTYYGKRLDSVSFSFVLFFLL